ncbi:MAG: HEAT repeat domain-containing protein [Gemmataceae bacterium]|nr:HEAT repeat domain-containing protein [Gemmataceae bacterium]
MRAAIAILLLALITVTAGGQSPGSTKEKDKKEKPKGPATVGGKTLAKWRETLRSSKDASIRADAIAAILQFGPDASEAVLDLLAVAESDKDISPRTKAMAALRFIEVSDSQVKDVVGMLAKRIDVVGPKSDPRRREQQAIIRLEALFTLGRFYRDASPAKDALISSTKDSASWEIRHQAVAVLWRLGLEMQRPKSESSPSQPPDPRIIEALLDAVMDRRLENTHRVKLEALMGLAAMGKPANQELQERLVKDLNIVATGPNPEFATSNSQARSIMALAALVHLGEKPEKGRAPLDRLVTFMMLNRNVQTRCQAISALSTLGKLAHKHLGDLVKLLDDKESEVAQAACAALSQLGETNGKIVDGLVKAVRHKDANRAAAAITALVNLKQDSEKVVNALEALKTDKDTDPRLDFLAGQALVALKKMTEPKKKP